MVTMVAVLWGFSYYMVSISLGELGTFALNSYRFIGAFAVAMTIAFKSLRKVNRDTVKYAALLGMVLTTVYVFATYGVKYTSISNASFLCALTAVFTPILAFVFKKEKPDKKLIFVIFLCIVSIVLLTLNKELKPALGDVLCLISTIAGAAHLLLTETAVRKESVNAFHVAVYQLAFVGLFSLVLSAAIETSHVPETPKIWGAVIFLSIFCTGAAFVTLAMAQRHTSASHAGVILTLEPVVGGIVAFFFAGEVLLPRAYAGAVMLVAGILILETDIKKVFKKVHKNT